MSKKTYIHLSRRETQIMEVLYAQGEATVREVCEQIDDAPTYNSARVILGILEDKEFVTHRRDGRRFIYRPRGQINRAKTTALRHMISTLFGGSIPRAVSALVEMSTSKLSEDELDDIARQIEKARKQRKERS